MPLGHVSLAESKRQDVTSRPSPAELAYDANVSTSGVHLSGHLFLKKAQGVGTQMLGTIAIRLFEYQADDI